MTDVIAVAYGVSVTWLHVTNRSSTRPLIHVHYFKYSLFSQPLSHSPSTIFFAYTMWCWFFRLTSFALIIIPFWFWIAFSTIKFISASTWDTFHNYCWFIYSFYHIKYFQIYILYFIGPTYSNKWILNSIITSIHVSRRIINGEKLIKSISIGLVMHGRLFTNTHFVANYSPETNSTITRAISFYSMNSDIYTTLWFLSSIYEYL